jgi:hypothetical protein
MTNLILQIEDKLIVYYDNSVYLNEEALFYEKLILSKKESYERHSLNKEKQYHSFDDKPAVVGASGNQYWYQHDKLHRDNDKPAVVYANGNQHWYQNGNAHRDNDLPAVVCADGYREWYQNGTLIKRSTK